MEIDIDREIEYHEEMIKTHSESIERLNASREDINLLKFVGNYYKFKNLYISIDSTRGGSLYGAIVKQDRKPSISLDCMISSEVCNEQIEQGEFEAVVIDVTNTILDYLITTQK